MMWLEREIDVILNRCDIIWQKKADKSIRYLPAFFVYSFNNSFFPDNGLCPCCLSASTTTTSVQSLAIHLHGVHIVGNQGLYSLLCVFEHCFHNRYPFFFNTLILWADAQIFLPFWVGLLTHLNLVVYIHSFCEHNCYYCENHNC